MSSAGALHPAAYKHTMRGEKALIVDDEPTNRLVLRAMLTQMGFVVTEAADGEKAISAFSAENPDIVFMDIMMPLMDGYEATRRIKALCGERFVPVIVLTAMNDEHALSKCIDAGGDDVLTKPYESITLRSKINAMMRIRDLHRNVHTLYQRMRQDEQIAEQVFNKAVTAGNIGNPYLNVLLQPASIFSGDTVLTAYGPGGDLHVLLGDFTGHGLAAAIGALPTSETFRAMIAKGFESADLMAEINAKLCAMLPSNMFLAACYVHVPHTLSHVTILNCGLPDVLLIDRNTGHVRKRIGSHHFPLGIDDHFPSRESFETLTLHPGDSLMLYSDGVIECRNNVGEEFGLDRLEDALRIGSAPQAERIPHLLAIIDNFRGSTTQHDDITLVYIPLIPELFPDSKQHSATTAAIAHDTTPIFLDTDSFFSSLTLSGQQLRQIDPIPLLLHQLHRAQLPEPVHTDVFVILTELYLNALDHGILAMDSSLKSGEHGFSLYLAERELRLRALNDGQVTIAVQLCQNSKSGRLTVSVSDTGTGFDISAIPAEILESPSEFGRGIGLVRALCRSVNYREPGNFVHAEYLWEL